MLSDAELREIVARATSLTERLAVGTILEDEPARAADVDSRFERWRRFVAGGDQALFERRLAMDGLTPADARRLFGKVRLPADTPLPAWTATLAAVLSDESWVETDRSMDPLRPVPMEEALLPFVRFARTRLAARTRASTMSDVALAAFEQDLLRSISSICANALVQEFFAFRAAQQSPLERGLAGKRTPPQHLYRRWLERMRTGGLTEFFRRFPVAARLTATVTDQWIDVTQETIDRLVADKNDIQALFADGVDIGGVVSANAGLSDAHSGGRTVAIVTFASGLRVVYKPRDLALESRWFRLLQWANDRGASPPLRPLKVLARPTHGWVEFAEQRACADVAEAERYYERAGMILALMHALGTTDLHDQNLVASGEQPMLIDLEMLVSHEERPLNGGAEQEPTAFVVADRMLADTVLSVGLLPRWVFGPDGSSQDISALGGGGDQKTLDRMATWQHPNTDDMRLVREHVDAQPQQNVVILDDRALSPVDYADSLVKGFRGLYQLLLRNRDALLDRGGPLEGLESERVRFLFRATREYFLNLNASYNRTLLRDGVDRSTAIDAPSRILVENPSLHAFWPVRKAEAEALERADIPLFVANAGSRSLPLGEHGEVPDCFGVSPAARARARIAALSLEDCERQVSFIRATLHLRVAREPRPSDTVASPAVAARPSGTLEPEMLVARAVAIARELVNNAVRAPHGGASWIAVQFFPQAGRYEMHPLGYGLYSGCAGVGLFFAALWRITASEEWRTWALEALQPLREELHRQPQRLRSAVGIGGADGIGSTIYVLTLVGEWLGEPLLLNAARTAATLIDETIVAADTQLDVIAGSAGAALGLLALYEASGDVNALARAQLCARHLVAKSVVPGQGLRAWNTIRDLPFAGFSHGAAGIAAALLRVHALGPDETLVTAAEQAVAYERTLFLTAHGNWPRLGESAPDGGPSIWTSWCHGAPGIALGRLVGLHALDTAAVREDLDIALSTTRAHGLEGVDQLCCGNMGRADILLEAAVDLGRADLAAEARELTSRVLEKADAGSYELLPGLPREALFPGFFQGSAGVGYALLRQAFPGRLPCVLAWRR
ncbi:MAG: type 2 lanthipeptide synthetase LanM family protein [Gemmatimonadota bacterium]